MDDLGRPPATRIARVLGVGASTVHRWNSAGHAPRAAQLALFWLTRWGRSAVHTQATNDAILAFSYLESLKSEVQRLEGNVRQLAALADARAVQLRRLSA
ncbi:hypothetical protein [Paucibacter sp. XJ19-41]|uniref:hypothetical protein n=1 Tax=Paucibacter sp. XJ19-41 TaxID=2927824 RepID=UPI00234A51C8|nr:hypothetical protein [Paucibacter sp. XJ19-41]MDC6168335.1 hypothetical protein [Paucibacter sp. XJ19-41]